MLVRSSGLQSSIWDWDLAGKASVLPSGELREALLAGLRASTLPLLGVEESPKILNEQPKSGLKSSWWRAWGGGVPNSRPPQHLHHLFAHIGLHLHHLHRHRVASSCLSVILKGKGGGPWVGAVQQTRSSGTKR